MYWDDHILKPITCTCPILVGFLETHLSILCCKFHMARSKILGGDRILLSYQPEKHTNEKIEVENSINWNDYILKPTSWIHIILVWLLEAHLIILYSKFHKNSIKPIGEAIILLRQQPKIHKPKIQCINRYDLISKS